MTSRELIMSLVLNCNLDDEIKVEVMLPNGTNNEGDPCYRFVQFEPRHVVHFPDNDALIECHDN